MVLGALAVVGLQLPDVRRRQGHRSQVNAVLHIVMAAGSAVMAWPAAPRVPAWAGAGTFAAAALWYVYLIAAPARGQRPPEVEGHHRGALLWYHVGMMAAMAWMYAVMPLSMASATPATAMAAMGARAGEAAAMGGGAPAGMSGWPLTVSWACVLLFVGAVLVFTGLLLRSLGPGGLPRPAGERRRNAAALAMAAVMLVGFGLIVLP